MPPGFESGMTFDPAPSEVGKSEWTLTSDTVNISEVLLGGRELMMGWVGEVEEEEEETKEAEGDVVIAEHPLQQVHVSPNAEMSFVRLVYVHALCSPPVFTVSCVG